MTFLILYSKKDKTYINTDLIATFVVVGKNIINISYMDGSADTDLTDVKKWELI